MKDAKFETEFSPPLTPRASALYGYWRAKAGDAPMPLRAAIDPVCEIPLLVANMFLLGVEPGPQFRYRVVGSALVARSRRDVTGKHVGPDLYGAYAPDALGPLERVVATGVPVRVRGILGSVLNAHAAIELLHLPLSFVPGGPVMQILGLLNYEVADDGAPFQFPSERVALLTDAPCVGRAVER